MKPLTANPFAAIAATATARVPAAPRGGPLRRRAGLVLTIGAVLLASSMLVPLVLGYQRYVITSGSMTGTYDRGSLIYDETVPTKSLKVGDVITYTPPAIHSPTSRLTHRIFAIKVLKDRTRQYQTKGDANPSPDPWTFTLTSPTQARVVFSIPYLGFVFAALSIPLIRILVLGVPALLVALGALGSLWEEAGQESRP